MRAGGDLTTHLLLGLIASRLGLTGRGSLSRSEPLRRPRAAAGRFCLGRPHGPAPAPQNHPSLAAAQAFTLPARAATLIALRPASQLGKAPGPRSTPYEGAPPCQGGDGFGEERNMKKTCFGGRFRVF
jgi:hypothetical protein